MIPPLSNNVAAGLITLSDGRAGVRAGLQVEIYEPSDPTLDQPDKVRLIGTKSDAGAPVLDFVASDETLDRGEEIISATGWRLEAYRQNPVFQNAHQY